MSARTPSQTAISRPQRGRRREASAGTASSWRSSRRKTASCLRDAKQPRRCLRTRRREQYARTVRHSRRQARSAQSTAGPSGTHRRLGGWSIRRLRHSAGACARRHQWRSGRVPARPNSRDVRARQCEEKRLRNCRRGGVRWSREVQSAATAAMWSSSQAAPASRRATPTQRQTTSSSGMVCLAPRRRSRRTFRFPQARMPRAPTPG